MEKLETRLETSASKIGLRQPFIMAATGKLPRIVVDDKPGFTAATNGEWFKFGRQWVESSVADEEELFGLDLHERMHVVFMHMWRREGRDPAVWNIANDAIINRMIRDMGYTLPKGGVGCPYTPVPPGGFNVSWVTAQMSSEEVYNKLMQQRPPEDDEGDGGEGGWDGKGDLEDSDDPGSAADMEATIRAAAQMARECGDGSMIIDRVLGSPPKASVCWTDEVRAMLTSAARDDYSFRKFSKRFMARRMYLPTLHSDALGGLVIGFDTSGSMTQDDARQVCGEIQGIVDDLSPDWVEVVYCDDNVQSSQRFNRGDTLELRPPQGGGTAFKPVFDHAATLQDNGDRIAGLIYLTDMCGNLAECVEPEFPVVWGCVYATPRKAPFGSVVQVIVR